MSTVAQERVSESQIPQEHFLNITHTVKSWLLTMDHKRVGILYLFVISTYFLVGGIYAGLIRLELLTPEADLMESDAFNTAFTMHGVAMIFFVLIPLVPAIFGNFCLPLMIGAKDVAFPKLNLLSWYVFTTAATGGVILVFMGGVDTGWTFYTPYSSTYSNGNVVLAATAAFLVGWWRPLDIHHLARMDIECDITYPLRPCELPLGRIMR